MEEGVGHADVWMNVLFSSLKVTDLFHMWSKLLGKSIVRIPEGA